MSNIETAIEEMIQTYIDEQDYVTGMTAEMYTDGEISDLRADMEGELGELQSRIEALEAKTAPAAEEQDENLLQELADSAPRAVNQIDWILGERAGSTSIFAGYPTIDMLEQFVRSTLGTEEESKTMMIIMMTLATARNLINEKLEAES
jgi:BMFP domain-containing protein YqiC